LGNWVGFVFQTTDPFLTPIGKENKLDRPRSSTSSDGYAHK